MNLVTIYNQQREREREVYLGALVQVEELLCLHTFKQNTDLIASKLNSFFISMPALID